MIQHQLDNNSSMSFVLGALEDQYANAVDEYVDDDDPGFDLYEVAERDFVSVAKQLADKYDFPARSCAPGPDKGDGTKDKETERNRNQFTPTDDSGLILQELKNKKEGDEPSSRNNNTLTDRTEKDKKPKGYFEVFFLKLIPTRYIHLPSHLKHPVSNDSFYPVVFENVIFDCFNMKVTFWLFISPLIVFLQRLFMTEKEQDSKKPKISPLLSTLLLEDATKSCNILALQLSVKLLK